MNKKHKFKEPKATNIVTSSGSFNVRHQFGSRRNKKFLGLFLGVTLVIVLGWFFIFNKSSNKQSAVLLPCTNGKEKTLLTDASKAMVSGKIKDLGLVATKIRALNGFEKDKNCLNVLVTYYIDVSDAINARNYLNKLNSIYDNKGFSPEIGPKAYNLKSMQEAVDLMEKSQKTSTSIKFIGQ